MNKKTIFIGIGVLAAAALAYAGYKWWQKNKTASAANNAPAANSTTASAAPKPTHVPLGMPHPVKDIGLTGEGRG